MNIEHHVEKTQGVFAKRYKLLKPLGAGGMGTVYLVSDLMLDGEKVALKILHPQFTQDKKLVKRFLREVRLTRKVTHPNVVRTFDIDRKDNFLFFTMEFAGGVSLKEKYIADAVDYKEVGRIIIEISKGLAAIHEAGIVHRDLKPGNVIITPDNSLKITDFGVARHGLSNLTAHDGPIGSALYMSPEVWSGKEVSEATDIYALGVVAYKLITGELPFDDDSPVGLMRFHLEALPLPPVDVVNTIPAWFNQLILNMLAKSPEARPQSAEEVIDSIQQWLSVEDPDNNSASDISSDFNTQDLQNALNDAMNSVVQEVEPRVLGGNTDSAFSGEKSGLVSMAIELTKWGRAWKENYEKAAQLSKDGSFWKKLSIASARFVLCAALLIGLAWYFSVGSAGQKILENWAAIEQGSGFMETLFGGTVPVFVYLVFLSCPLMVFSISKSSILSSLWLWFKVFVGSFVLLLFIFEFNCIKVGKDDLVSRIGVNTEGVQWVLESSIRNLVEVSMLVPHGTNYGAPSASFGSYDITDSYDSVLNFKGGYLKSELEYASSTSFGTNSSLVLIENRDAGVVASIPYYLFWFIYVALLSTLACRAHLGAKWNTQGLKKIGLATAFICGLGALELLAESSVYELSDWFFPVEHVLKIGPFYQVFTGYALVCAVFNWSLVFVLLWFFSAKHNHS